MRSKPIGLLALVIAGLFGLAVHAQNILGFPPGTFVSRAPLDGSAAPPAFVGALDVNNTNTRFYAGLDPPTISYSGNVFRVCDLSTGATCADATAAAGVVTLPTIGGSPCNNSGNQCVVAELYDTSGRTFCDTGGGANTDSCNFLQATNSKRPLLFVGTPNYMIFSNSVLCVGSGGTTYVQAQPHTISLVINQTGSSTGTVLGDSANNEYDGGGASGINMYNGGASLSQASTNGNWYAVQYVANNASSRITIDASPTSSPPNTGTASMGNMCIGAYNSVPSFAWPGKIREIGQWSGDVGNTINQAMIANQKTRGGF